MIFNKYPYTDFHEMNLDWLLTKMKELDASFDEFSALNKTKIAGNWDISKQYEVWSIVNDNGNGFISIKPVPAGVGIDDVNYWMPIGLYGQAIADLGSRLARVEEKTQNIEAIGNATIIEGDSLQIATENGLVYGVTSPINDYFGKVPAKDLNGNEYNILLENTRTAELTAYVDRYSINVGDYMATGMSFKDAILLAIQNCPPHGTVYIPYGNYSIDTPIEITKPMQLIGEYNGYDYEEYNQYTPKSEFEKMLITTSSAVGINIRCSGVIVKNIGMVSTSSAAESALIQFDPTGIGSYLNQISKCLIENCDLFGNQNVTYGVVSKTRPLIVSTFRNVRTYFVQTGFFIATPAGNCTSLLFQNCWAFDPYDTGYFMDRVYYSKFTGCAVDSAGTSAKTGYNLIRCFSVSIDSCGAEWLDNAAVIFNLCNECSINGMTMARCNDLASPNFAPIMIVGTSRVTIDNVNDDMVNAVWNSIIIDDTSLVQGRNCNFGHVVLNGIQKKCGRNFAFFDGLRLVPSDCDITYSNYVINSDLSITVSGIIIVTGPNPTVTILDIPYELNLSDGIGICSQPGTYPYQAENVIRFTGEAISYDPAHATNYLITIR